MSPMLSSVALPVIGQRCCPVCGACESVPIRDIELMVPDNLPLQRSFTINSCTDCGMIFHDIRPQNERETYYETYTGEDITDYPVSADQRAFNELTIGFLQRQALQKPGLAILDVGCSFGITLLELKALGFDDLYAIDPDRSAIAYLQRQGVPGRTGSVSEHFADLNARFDLIILRHVLEHLEDPAGAVANVATWLKPGGRIYIELPDLRRYPECAPFPGYFFEFEHINHFSEGSLRNLMRQFNLLQYESTPDIYPCLRTLFEPTPHPRPVLRDASDVSHVEASLDRPTVAGRHTIDKIAALDGREVALWGVSTLAYRMLTHTPLRHCRIRHLVDRDPGRQGETLMGLPITTPDSLRSFTGDIVLCGENSADSIEEAIRGMGLSNRIVRLLQPAA